MNGKMLRLLLVGTLVAVGLAGCADTGDESTDDSDAPSPTDDIDQGVGDNETTDNETNTTDDNSTVSGNSTAG